MGSLLKLLKFESLLNQPRLASFLSFYLHLKNQPDPFQKETTSVHLEFSCIWTGGTEPYDRYFHKIASWLSLKNDRKLQWQFNLNQSQKEAVVDWAWSQEMGDTMFHVVNTYTRASQFKGLSAENSYQWQRVGGNILEMLNWGWLTKLPCGWAIFCN